MQHFAHRLDSRLVDTARLGHHNTLDEARDSLIQDALVIEHVADVYEDLGVSSLLVRVVEARSVDQSNIGVVFNLDTLSHSLSVFARNEGSIFTEFQVPFSKLIFNDCVSSRALSVSHLPEQK